MDPISLSEQTASECRSTGCVLNERGDWYGLNLSVCVVDLLVSPTVRHKSQNKSNLSGGAICMPQAGWAQTSNWEWSEFS